MIYKSCFWAILFLFISQVNFLSKLVALRPGKTVRSMIKSVMEGKDEGAESSEGEDGVMGEIFSGGIAGKVWYFVLFL